MSIAPWYRFQIGWREDGWNEVAICSKAGAMCGPACHAGRAGDAVPRLVRASCGNKKCGKQYGFMMFKVSEKRGKEIQLGLKEESAALAQKQAQIKRRAVRGAKLLLSTKLMRTYIAMARVWRG